MARHVLSVDDFLTCAEFVLPKCTGPQLDRLRALLEYVAKMPERELSRDAVSPDCWEDALDRAAVATFSVEPAHQCPHGRPYYLCLVCSPRSTR
jgi:hypothetical protein